MTLDNERWLHQTKAASDLAPALVWFGLVWFGLVWFGRSYTLHLTFEMMRFLPPPQNAP